MAGLIKEFNRTETEVSKWLAGIQNLWDANGRDLTNRLEGEVNYVRIAANHGNRLQLNCTLN
jgi:hypothetical protein